MTMPTVETNRQKLAEAIARHLQGLRELEFELNSLDEHVHPGSPVHRGLKLVQRDMRSAADNLERMRSMARTQGA
jgi:hypothetical protein